MFCVHHDDGYGGMSFAIVPQSRAHPFNHIRVGFLAWHCHVLLFHCSGCVPAFGVSELADPGAMLLAKSQFGRRSPNRVTLSQAASTVRQENILPVAGWCYCVGDPCRFI